jgi:hypothetical protein
MSVSGVSGANSAVPLLDPSQSNQTNAAPPKNDNDADEGASVKAKAPTAPGTGKIVDKTA